MEHRNKKNFLAALTVAGLLHNFAMATESLATEYIVRSPNTRLFGLNENTGPQFKVMNLDEVQAKSLREHGMILEKNQKWQLQSYTQLKGHNPLSGPLPINQGDGTWGINYIQSPVANLLDFGSGEGITVCVVDTGVDANHPSLQGRVVENHDLSSTGPSLLSNEIWFHGTVIASIIAGNVLPKHRGIAPKAKILSVKIFGDGVDTTTDRVVKGISYCIGRSQVINLSFGGQAGSEIISEVLQEALRQGISVFAAAGNGSGPIYYPASEPGVFAIGAMGRNLRVADFSSRGPQLSAVAPGVGLLAAAAEGTYSNTSGTSISAAFATGVEALRRSRQAKELGYINLNVDPDVQGHGLVHALVTAAKTRD